MSRLKVTAGALGTGLLLAASIPPWGWWPLAFLGIVALDRLLAAAEGRRWTVRWCRGWLVGFGLYLPSLAWMKDLTLPGYLIATVAYAALFGVALAIVPSHAPGRWLALPGAIALTELLRWSWPFGGVPLSSLAVGQVSGPLAPVLRIGGALLLVELTVITGLVLAVALARNWRATGIAAGVVAVLWSGRSWRPGARRSVRSRSPRCRAVASRARPMPRPTTCRSSRSTATPPSWSSRRST